MKTAIKSNNNVLFRNFDIFSQSENSVKNFKSLVFQSALNGRLDFRKLSNGKITKPLQSLIEEQKAYLKKEGIAFEEQSDCIWPMVELGDISEVSSGNSAPQKKELFKNGQYPFCRTSDVGKAHISDNFKEISDYLNNEGIKGLKLFKKDTILIPKSGASTFLNHRVILGIDSYVSSHLATVYANKELIIPNLLFNLLCAIDAKKLTSEQNYPSLKLPQIQLVKIPLPPPAAQKEIVALMEKCALLETQIKEKTQKQNQFSKSTMHFITQSQNKKELSHHWSTLGNNFKDALYSRTGAKEFKAMAFQLCLKGRLDFKKLSNGKIKKPLQTLIQEQKAYLKKEGIAFEERPDSVWPLVELRKILETVKYTNKIKKSSFLKEGTFPIVDQSEKFISGYWNKKTDVFKIKKPVIVFGDHTCCFKYIDFDFVLGADGIKIIQPNKQFLPFFLYYLLLNTKIRNLGYSRHFKALKIKKIPLPPLAVQREVVTLMTNMESLEKQIQKEKNLSVQLSQSLSYIEN